MKKVIGIVIADEMEFKSFTEYAQKNFPCQAGVRRGNESLSVMVQHGSDELLIHAVKCGIGKVNAASAASFLIADDGANVILNAGLSGAVKGVRREEVVIGSSYVEADFDLTAIGYELGAKPGQEHIYPADENLLVLAQEAFPELKSGRLGCGDIFLADPVKKKRFDDAFDLCAFDMETGAIASVCKKTGVPFLSIRKVSDDADDCATYDYQEMNDRAEADLTELLFQLLEKILKNVV